MLLESSIRFLIDSVVPLQPEYVLAVVAPADVVTDLITSKAAHYRRYKYQNNHTRHEPAGHVVVFCCRCSALTFTLRATLQRVFASLVMVVVVAVFTVIVVVSLRLRLQ